MIFILRSAKVSEEFMLLHQGRQDKKKRKTVGTEKKGREKSDEDDDEDGL